MTGAKRIILATIGSLGDLHPLVAIGLDLRKRGHSVAFATTDIYRVKIERLGFEFCPLRPSIASDERELIRLVLDLKRGPERLLREVLFPALRDSYEDLYAVASDADFLLAGEIVYAAPLVAEKAGLKWATYVTSPMSFFSAYDPPVLAAYPWLAKLRRFGPTINRAVMGLARRVTRAWCEPVWRLRRELKLPTTFNPVFEGKYSQRLNLAGFSPVLAEPQPDWPPNTVVTGFTFYDAKREGAEWSLSPALETFLGTAEPPIVFTLGSAAVHVPGRFFEESARAAAMLKRRAVLLTGDNPPPADLPMGTIASTYAPFSELFPRARAVVHSGGIGTVSQALRSGRPMIVTPYGFDQPDNAARLARLGTSCTIHRNAYTAERIATQLERLLQRPRYTERAVTLAQRLHDEDGTRVACDAIEDQLRNGR